MNNEMIICPDCNGENSKNAENCIYCNFIFKEIEIQSQPKFIENQQINVIENQQIEQEKFRINRNFNFGNNTISKYILLFAGIIGVIAFFLPFFEMDFIIFKGELSGFKEVKTIIQGLAKDNSNGRQVLVSFFDLFQDTDNKTIIGILIGTFILLGPILYGIFSVRMIIRSLLSSVDDFTPLVGALLRGIIYIVVAFITLALLGDEIGIDINFFRYVGAGFWLDNVALIMCFVAMITNSKKQ